MTNENDGAMILFHVAMSLIVITYINFRMIELEKTLEGKCEPTRIQGTR